jgi:hypothetical protein
LIVTSQLATVKLKLLRGSSSSVSAVCWPIANSWKKTSPNQASLLLMFSIIQAAILARGVGQSEGCYCRLKRAA